MRATTVTPTRPFTWDANGNPSGGGNTVGTNNRLTSDGTYNYTHDDEGNVTRKTKISDGSYTDYTWDYRNRLTSVVSKTSGSTITMSADYAYDIYDRRIKKVVDADGAGGGGSVTSRYVYEDTGYTQVVLQFDGSSNITHRYLHGPAIDQLLASEDANNDLLWSLTDHQGTVRDLINNSGTVQNHLKYAAFGNVTAESAAAVDFLMGFAGMDRDEETGSWYSWMRHMQNGRWNSPDPWGFGAGDANLNRYVGNSPVAFIDPTGLETVTVGDQTFSYTMTSMGPFKDISDGTPGAPINMGGPERMIGAPRTYDNWDWLDYSANFAAGFGDVISFGATWQIRQQMGTNGGIDPNSGTYWAGGATGAAVAVTIGFGPAPLTALGGIAHGYVWVGGFV